MKKILEKLNELNLNFDMFYTISFDKRGITLQGHINKDTREACEKLGFEFILTENNWIESTNKKGVVITLTF